MISAIGVFAAAVVTDAVWAYYIRHTAAGNLWKASLSSFLLVLLGGYIVVGYVENASLLPVAALGGFIGTFLAVWPNRNKVDEKFKVE